MRIQTSGFVRAAALFACFSISAHAQPAAPKGGDASQGGPKAAKQGLAPESLAALRKQISDRYKGAIAEYKKHYAEEKKLRAKDNAAREELEKRQLLERIEFETKSGEEQLAMVDSLKGKTPDDLQKATLEYQTKWGKKSAEFNDSLRKEVQDVMDKMERSHKDYLAARMREEAEQMKKNSPQTAAPPSDSSPKP